MNWIKENWFQVAILALILLAILAMFSYFAIILPAQERAEERREAATEQKKVDAAQLAEEERQSNLEMCLNESDYMRTTSHIALCGDPNVGKSSSSCFEVYSGANSYDDVVNSYEEEFPDALPPYPEQGSLDEIIEAGNKREKIVSDYFDSCNCGLEKYRRDELDEAKKERDKLCSVKYAN